MRRPSEYTLLAHLAWHGWLGLALSAWNAYCERPQPKEPPAVVETATMGPNGLPRSCQ